MRRITEVFENKKVFMGFVTAGENGLDQMAGDLLEMEKEGFDIIELGIPFSDPAGEDKDVQDNNIKSLKAGCTADWIFDMLEETQQIRTSRVVLNLYVNTAYRYGFEAFLSRCQRAGVSACRVLDLPLEERDVFSEKADRYGVSVIATVAMAPDERIRRIAKKADGFLFISPSVGRENAEKKPSIIRHIQNIIKEETDLPVVIGIDRATQYETKRYLALGAGVRVRYQK